MDLEMQSYERDEAKRLVVLGPSVLGSMLPML